MYAYEGYTPMCEVHVYMRCTPINLLCEGLAKPRGREVAVEVASPIQSREIGRRIWNSRRQGWGRKINNGSVRPPFADNVDATNAQLIQPAGLEVSLEFPCGGRAIRNWPPYLLSLMPTRIRATCLLYFYFQVASRNVSQNVQQ
jgi:hypothetical protein